MKTLFVIDDPEGKNGAAIATQAMVRVLRQRGHDVDVFSGEGRKGALAVARRGLRDVLCDGSCSCREKIYRIGVTFCKLLGTRYREIPEQDEQDIRKTAASYDQIVAVGENSPYRYVVASLRGVRKVLLVHTDLVGRHAFLGGWRMRERDYVSVYADMDAVGIVGVVNAENAGRAYPQLAGKIRPFYNLISVTAPVCARRQRNPDGVIKVVSMVRFDRNKDVERMLRVAARLKGALGRDLFRWTIYGDGERLDAARRLGGELGVDDIVDLPGYQARESVDLCDFDLMVLASHYEGLPNVIYESFLSGVPVLSTRVGGIREQIEDGVNGWLVDDSEEGVCDRMRYLLLHPDEIDRASRSLDGYVYDNARAVSEMEDLLCLSTL